MKPSKNNSSNKAVTLLKQGGVIAYPTEAVFGLGCDPFNETAIERILSIKQRSAEKGFILIASNWQQLEPLVVNVEETLLDRVLSSWPGPITWVFPASSFVPHWLCGPDHSLAVRVTDHPVVVDLCDAYAGPLVSTSANRISEAPALDVEMVSTQFSDKIDYIVPGKVGGLKNPSEIRDAITGKVIREAIDNG